MVVGISALHVMEASPLISCCCQPDHGGLDNATGGAGHAYRAVDPNNGDSSCLLREERSGGANENKISAGK